MNRITSNQTNHLLLNSATQRTFIAFTLPTLCYVVVATVLLGTIAFTASTNMIANQPNKDIWQHVAALQVLMENLSDPLNPFVPTTDTSRHFHPLWVATAAIAQFLDISAWTALRAATYFSMGLFGVTVFVFGRTYFKSPWAPLVLIGTLLFGWLYQVEHTGLTSFRTLLYAAVYPATFMISLSLLLWTLVIKALEGAKMFVWIMLLVAFSFATHQLGAVIGLIAAGCCVLFWPDAELRARFSVSAAVILGLGISLFWPYQNPLMLVIQPGNSTWSGGPDFYGIGYMTIPFLPAVIGILGLRGPRARALLLALVIYYGIYLIGLIGPQIAARFMMPAILMLHIGLAGYILNAVSVASLPAMRRTFLAGILIATMISCFSFFLMDFHKDSAELNLEAPDLYGSVGRLTADIPDTEPVAAHYLSAWLVVGTGQRVLSVPWPEPGIHDLADRQAATRSLFDIKLTPEDRRALAESLGVRTLIVQWRPARANALNVLATQSVKTTREGVMWRFDLYD